MSVRQLEQVATYREHLQTRLFACDVPETLHDGLLAYFTERRPTGSFLRACLSNDLTQAIRRADPINQVALLRIVGFLLNHAPATAWGSPAIVEAWLTDTSPVPTPFD